MKALPKLVQWFVAEIGNYDETTSEKSEDGKPIRRDSIPLKFSPKRMHDSKDQPLDIVFQKLTVMMKQNNDLGMDEKDIEEFEHFLQQEKEIQDNKEQIEKLAKRNLELEGINSDALFQHYHKAKARNKKTCSAVVFDCGTGETKCLLYRYTDTNRCEVSLEEIHNGEAIIDLIKKETPLSDIVKQMTDKYRKAVDINKKQVDYNIVGASSWARKVYDTKEINRKKDNLLFEFAEEGLYPKILNQREECNFELLAVIYIFTIAVEAKMIDGKKKLSGVLASGGGSCQYSYLNGDTDSILLDIGSKEGIDKFMDEVKGGKTGNEPLDAIDKWLEEQKKIIMNKIEVKNYQTIDGFVICLAAQFYAAKEIKRIQKTIDGKNFCNDDNEANFVSKKSMVEAAKAYVEKQRHEWMIMSAENKQKLLESKEKRKTLKDWAKNYANVSICCLFWESFLKDDADMCFKRDWQIEDVKYRNTWSAGWFLNQLRLQEIKVFKRQVMVDIFSKIQEEEKDKSILRRYFQFKYPKAAKYLSDMSVSHLAFSEEMAERLKMLAKQKAKEVDEWLKEIKNECNKLGAEEVRLIGFDESEDFPNGIRLKSKESIERKLIDKLSSLLITKNRNRSDGILYSPTEKELMSTINDGLRYTLVFNNSTYYQGVNYIEKYLIGKKGCKIKAKNFWQNEEGQSTYMGINILFYLPFCPIAADSGFAGGCYPVELQIHTPASIELKEGESHKIYEEIRVESVRERRKELNKQCCELWDKIEVPTIKTDGREESMADYKGDPSFGEKSAFTHIKLDSTSA